VAAAGAFLWHAQSKPWDEAVFIALAVAVIACPCCAWVCDTARRLDRYRAVAGNWGVIARSGSAVEKLAEIDVVVFDKTGTLTLPDEYGVLWRCRTGLDGTGRRIAPHVTRRRIGKPPSVRPDTRPDLENLSELRSVL